MNTISKSKLLAAIAGVGITLSSASYANIYQQQSYGYVKSWEDRAASEGLYETHNPYIDWLMRGKTDFLNIYLEEGVEYLIGGGCDEDCFDMDFELFDSNGNTIDQDFMPDDIPMVRVTPRWSDTFRLKVSIPDCRAYRCTYGVGVFGG